MGSIRPFFALAKNMFKRISFAEFTDNVISFFIVLYVECYYLLIFVGAKLRLKLEVIFHKQMNLVNSW